MYDVKLDLWIVTVTLLLISNEQIYISLLVYELCTYFSWRSSFAGNMSLYFAQTVIQHY